MKGKGLIAFFTIIFTAVCVYVLSFTWAANNLEKEAQDIAESNKATTYKEAMDSLLLQDDYFLGNSATEVRNRAIHLGLDLQGGISITLESSIPSIISKLADDSQDPNFVKAMQEAQVAYKKSPQANFVTLFGDAFATVAPNSSLASSTIFGNQEMGTKINAKMTNKEVLTVVEKEVEAQIASSFDVLRNRIDKFGVVSPTIQRLPQKNRILVELPGAEDQDKAEKLLTGAANLEFWETYNNDNTFAEYINSANKALASALGYTEVKDSSATTSQDSTSTDTSKAKSEEEFKQENPLSAVLYPAIYQDEAGQYQYMKGGGIGISLIKDTSKVNAYLALNVVKEAFPADVKFLWGKAYNPNSLMLYAIKKDSKFAKPNKAPISGDMITSSNQTYDDKNQPAVSVQMNPQGASIWREMTKELASRTPQGAIAIVLDDFVYSAPSVNGEIPNGQTLISGSFQVKEAQDLANLLNAGKMKAPFHIVESAKVGATLGTESIEAGLISAIAGLLVILIFAVIYYSEAGIVAAITLVLNLFFLIAVMASLGSVLTLPGIAGIVLSIGMAVDANVLIYERIKEALAEGKSLRQAIEDAFSMKGAIPAILDSNLTTLLTGFILLAFGAGAIKGFATTLVVGIIISLFTSIFFTRYIFDWYLEKGKNLKFSIPMTEKLFQDNDFDFLSGRKKFYIVSLIIIALGLGSIIFKGFGLGVDFQGGRSYVARFEQSVSEEKVRTQLDAVLKGSNTEVKSYGSGNQLRITSTYRIDDTSQVADAQSTALVLEAINKAGAGKAEIVSSQKVTSSVVDDLKSSAIWSVVLSLVGIFGYLLFRFGRWQFGAGALAGLIYTVVFVLAVFSIFNGILPFSLDIDSAFIAAILTVVGYAINDTVVVFDRIREYLGEKDYKKENVATVVNAALNSTLSRTAVTGTAVILVLLILLVFGGASIRGFSFAMLIGIIVGTYASLFVASPVVVDLALRSGDGLAHEEHKSLDLMEVEEVNS